MATLVEMATEMVIARARTTPLTAEEMVAELSMFHNSLKKLEAGESVEPVQEEKAAPTISLKEAFKKNEVVCMLCGKGGFKTLTRHLATAHGLKPREYRKQFDIPTKQSLSAKSYSETRRQMANDRGLADKLAKAREVRKANLEASKAKPAAKAPKAKAVAKSKPAKAKAPKAA